MGCPFEIVVALNQPAPVDEFCWRIVKVTGLNHRPCSGLKHDDSHTLDPRVAQVLPQGPLPQDVLDVIRSYVLSGKLKLKQVMGMLANDFPSLVTSERQVRNAMLKHKQGVHSLCCRALLEVLLTESAKDPDFFVAYKLDDDNVLTGVLWITPDQRKAWLETPDILIHDNTYELDDQGFKLGNFNGIDKIGRTIDLGTAFVLDEDSCTYEWQFETWKAAMFTVMPTVFGSDADPAASLAAEASFPGVPYFWCKWHINQNLFKNLQGKLGGLMPKFLTDFEAVAATLGEACFMHRWGLLLQKYPAASPYLTKQLGGTNVHRWGAAFLQTFTCSTRSTSRGEGSNKDYKCGNKRNLDVLQVYKNITEVQNNKKKRRLQTDVAANIDTVGAVECAHLWFKEVTRIVKQNCSPYAQQMVHKQMVHSGNYYVKEQCDAGVLPADGDLNSDDVTLTQGDSVSEIPEDSIFDLSKFCNNLATADLNDADPYRRCNLSDYLAKNEVGEDFTVLTVQHDKYDAVQYVILFGKVDMGSQGTCYHGHYCTCGYRITSGVPCRHFWAVHKRIATAAFCLGQVHTRWLTTSQGDDYELVTYDGVLGTTVRIDPVVTKTTSVINPLTQELTEVSIDKFKQSRTCYGKLWGLCRKFVSAVTVDYGEVQQDEYGEIIETLERLYTKVKDRADLQAASEEDQPLLRALQEVRNVQDNTRVNNKSAKGRKCGYCHQVGTGHNKASCPLRAKHLAAAEASAPTLSAEAPPASAPTLPAVGVSQGVADEYE